MVVVWASATMKELTLSAFLMASLETEWTRMAEKVSMPCAIPPQKTPM